MVPARHIRTVHRDIGRLEFKERESGGIRGDIEFQSRPFKIALDSPDVPSGFHVGYIYPAPKSKIIVSFDSLNKTLIGFIMFGMNTRESLIPIRDW